ncbi:MAG: hypothetical protein JNL72_03185 [Flavipsychrobacter sp.]|nr:hypothetical protein [Flavipsychrobacter sp.]
MNQGVMTVLEILKYVIPGIVVLIATNMVVGRFLNSEFRQKQLAMLSQTQDVTIRLRLQAYERLSLFVERIHPRQLVPRIYQQGMTVTDLQQALIYNINTEFEHNLAQQIYVTRQAWETVRRTKEQEIAMISQIAKNLDPTAPGRDLHVKIVDYILTTPGELPTEIALNLINEEAKRILSYGAQA